MKGYVRRKVTYNIGKGTGPGPPPAQPLQTSGGRKRFSLLPDTESLFPTDIKYVVVDNEGRWEVDKEYIDQGLEEGWLVWSGKYQRGEFLVRLYSPTALFES